MAILFISFLFNCSQNFKLFGFPIFRFWAYLMKVIPETRHVHNYDWYTTTIHQTKYSRWNNNNCGADTLGQEKRYIHINVHTLAHIWGGGGDEREHIHISGDSSPICKRHLQSMLKGIKSYLCLVQTGHVDIEIWCGRKGERHTNM